MRRDRVRGGALLIVSALLGAGCLFSPDLTRFPECGEDGSCAEGATCVQPDRRCVPDCLDCPGEDAGETDGGFDADGGGGLDAGVLTLSPSALRYGVEGTPYELIFEVDGGTPPYAFSFVDSLPAGMSLSTQGAFSGTPPAAGSFPIRPRVEDSSAPPLTTGLELVWVVHPLLRVAGPGLLAQAANNQAYAEVLSGTGGVPPYEFRIVDGGLPGTLQLHLDGGTAADAATEVGFTVEISDSATPPQTAQRDLNFKSAGAPLALTIMTRSLPDARVGTPYEYLLQTRGGELKEWSFSESLPPGITLNQTTGLLYGTPTQASLFTFHLTATDTLLGSTAPEQFTLQVF